MVVKNDMMRGKNADCIVHKITVLGGWLNALPATSFQFRS